MPRGGKRYGSPGANYNNRSDLQAVRVAPGQQYGKATEQRKAQQAVPMAGATSPGPPPAPSGGGGAPAGMPALLGGPPPGLLTPLDAPTTRPNEPLTAGMAMGAGPGMEANPFAQVGSAEDAKLALMAALQAYPSPELLAILEGMDSE